MYLFYIMNCNVYICFSIQRFIILLQSSLSIHFILLGTLALIHVILNLEFFVYYYYY